MQTVFIFMVCLCSFDWTVSKDPIYMVAGGLFSISAAIVWVLKKR